MWHISSGWGTQMDKFSLRLPRVLSSVIQNEDTPNNTCSVKNELDPVSDMLFKTQNCKCLCPILIATSATCQPLQTCGDAWYWSSKLWTDGALDPIPRIPVALSNNKQEKNTNGTFYQRYSRYAMITCQTIIPHSGFILFLKSFGAL